ncbi:hypothetical protein ACFPC0_10650 [Streptomyces andamanensis]|uniref:Uncharacterized protein n=1 Tax=Streptomyces andamanensis TaxID=1565035 RepID=A0ABV8TCH9_9ACTN
METRDPLAQALFGLGCAAIVGAPLYAVAVACTSSSSHTAPPPPARRTAASVAPSAATATQKGYLSPQGGSSALPRAVHR